MHAFAAASTPVLVQQCIQAEAEVYLRYILNIFKNKTRIFFYITRSPQAYMRPPVIGYRGLFHWF